MRERDDRRKRRREGKCERKRKRGYVRKCERNSEKKLKSEKVREDVG
jgi:hypothetical protein